jgi:hypothetical protein
MERTMPQIRPLLIGVLALVVFATSGIRALAQESTPGSDKRFKFLHDNGNSSCSVSFLSSISTMQKGQRLQGSCCSEMSQHHYGEQVESLKKFAAIGIIPPDPYDIDAGLAQRLLVAYDLPLTGDERAAYDYAMQKSHEKGPCCCQCWRWRAYGGLAKLLIRDHHFTGEQVTEVWNLSDGCGGDD